MTEFVQIGDWAFRPACIQEVRFEAQGGVTIYWHLAVQPDGAYDITRLIGIQAERFKAWWVGNPSVTICGLGS
jgi:hypothetical protein